MKVIENTSLDPAAPKPGPVIDVLRTVEDPELGLNVVDLGLIVELEVSGSVVRILAIMTSPSCPVGPEMLERMREAVLKGVPGVTEVRAEITWDMPWSPDLMTPRGRSLMGWP